jgi:hypothetical protein
MEFGRAVEHLNVAVLMNQNSATVCYSCYAGYINNSVSGTALATASLEPQVAGDCIVLWLVVLPIK